ncbi:TIGR03086 family metal-binding protein [Dactylosporangium sp. NPDC000555]|uniref:TIGR03086 family metal-binding protein n=1 Tax=Dactylosporangium sp. NPDC000555 TaxID=3154260 RepID=UPI003316EFC0
MAFPDFRAADAIAVRTSVKLLDGPLDLALPTPCAGWNLADLLAHMTVQHLGFAAAARGEAWPLDRWRPGRLGADPVAEYAAAAEDVIAAFAAVDALDLPMSLPEIAPGPLAAWRGIGAHAIDYVAHGWDVARSVGRTFTLSEDVLTAVLPIAEGVPDGPSRDRPGSAFAHALPVTGDASTLDRILLLLGRSPA